MRGRYNAEIVAGALMPEESRVLASLVLEDRNRDEISRLVRVENVLQKRSPANAYRKWELIEKRFAYLDRALIELVAHGRRQSANQALLIGAIQHSKLIGDFLLRVVKPKWRTFDKQMRSADWSGFLAECEQLDPFVAGLSDSTRVKLGQVVKKCLVEAGYLSGPSNPSILPVLLDPAVKRFLDEQDDSYVSDCLTVTS